MKFILTTLLLLFSSPLLAQEEEEVKIDYMVIDTLTLRKKLTSSPLITREQLCANRWRMDYAWIQWFKHYETEAPMYQEIQEYGYVYTFHEDGTYNIDAVLDTDGTWYFDEEKNMVIIRSNFRNSLNKDAYMMLRGDILVVYEWDHETIMATFMSSTDEGYDD